MQEAFHDPDLETAFREMGNEMNERIIIESPTPPTIGDLDNVYHTFHYATDTCEELDNGWYRTEFVREKP